MSAIIPKPEPSLAKTVTGLHFKEEEKLRILEAAAALDLPLDVKCRLVQLVFDPPPPSGIEHISIALSENVINAGLAQENLVTKASRVLFWALLYFPFQFVQYHLFLRWATGQNLKEDSDQVEKFRKNTTKIGKEIMKQPGCRCIGLVKTSKTSDPHSVSGFRLSASGTDYADKVAKRKKARVDVALRQYKEAMSDERIQVEDIDNPAMRAFIEDEKGAVAGLLGQGTFDHFSETPPQLPAAAENDDGKDAEKA